MASHARSLRPPTQQPLSQNEHDFPLRKSSRDFTPDQKDAVASSSGSSGAASSSSASKVSVSSPLMKSQEKLGGIEMPKPFTL